MLREQQQQRLEQKAIRMQAARCGNFENEERKEQSRAERQKELAHEMNVIRKNLWYKHHEKEEERKKNQAAATETVRIAKENARIAAEVAAGGGLGGKGKTKGTGTNNATDKDVDSVEGKMRAKLERKGKENELEQRRQMKFEVKNKSKIEKEMNKITIWKEFEQALKESEIRKYAERAAAAEEAAKAQRMQAMQERDKTNRRGVGRNLAINRKGAERMRKLCPKFKPKESEFMPV